MEIVVERREGVVIVAVAGSVDGMTAGELVTSMREQVSAGNPRLVGRGPSLSRSRSVGTLSFQLPGGDRRTDLLRVLREEIWPLIPARLLGKGISRRERERILGYGPRGA